MSKVIDLNDPTERKERIAGTDLNCNNGDHDLRRAVVDDIQAMTPADRKDAFSGDTKSNYYVSDFCRPVTAELVGQGVIVNVPEDYSERNNKMTKDDYMTLFRTLDWTELSYIPRDERMDDTIPGDTDDTDDTDDTVWTDDNGDNGQGDLLDNEEPEEPDEEPDNTGANVSLGLDLANLEDGINDAIKSAVDNVKEDVHGTLDTVESKLSELENRTPRTIQVKNGNDVVSTIDDVTHYRFDDVLKWLSMDEHVYLCGPSATGKTHSAKLFADALDVTFYSESIAADTDSYKFQGYMDESGNYVETKFFKAITEGGLFLVDEFDTGSSSLLKWFNSAIENGLASFPHGMFEVSDDFYMVATGNTWGHGGNREYNAGQDIDESIFDRFIPIEWNPDEDMERAVAGDTKWTEYVQNIRDFVHDNGIRATITMRAMIKGNKGLKNGFSWDKVENQLIFNRMKESTASKIKNNVEQPTQ